MKKKNSKIKRAITLVEITVVAVLIMIITSALAMNYTKSLEKGKEFKTRHIGGRLGTVLNLALAQGDLTPTQITDGTWAKVANNSDLIKDGQNFGLDAWGDAFKVTHDTTSTPPRVVVESTHLKGPL